MKTGLAFIAVCLLLIFATRVAPTFVHNTPLVIVPESKLELSCRYLPDPSKRQGNVLTVYLSNWLESPSFADTLRLLLASKGVCVDCFWGFTSNEDLIIDLQKKMAERVVNITGIGTLGGDLYDVEVVPSRIILTSYNNRIQRTIDRASGRYIMIRYADGTIAGMRSGEASAGSIGWCQTMTSSN